MRVAVRPVPGAALFPADTDALIIDVLRATTTLTVAKSHGATRIVPCGTPEEALALRGRHAGSLACGERGGRMVPGFDLGNSPEDYTEARVRGRILVFASTNGSRAMLAARGARRRRLAAFVNGAAVVDAVAAAPHVTIVCSGKLGEPSIEDLACAGWLCARLEARGAVCEGAGARMARAIAPRTPDEVLALVSGGAHARELTGLGPAYARDVAFCAQIDVLSTVVEL